MPSARSNLLKATAGCSRSSQPQKKKSSNCGQNGMLIINQPRNGKSAKKKSNGLSKHDKSSEPKISMTKLNVNWISVVRR